MMDLEKGINRSARRKSHTGSPCPAAAGIGKQLSAFVACLILLCTTLAGCESKKNQPPQAPVGRWEYIGALPGGGNAIIRIAIAPGPFVKYVGFRAPDPIPHELDAEELAGNLESRWNSMPEILHRFENGAFYAMGGANDGQLVLRHDPEANTLESLYPDSAGLIFQPVKGNFHPFVFGTSAAGEGTSMKNSAAGADSPSQQ